MAKKAKKKENSVTRSLYYYDFIWNVYDDNRNRYTPIKRQDERFTHFLEKFHFSKKETVDKKYILSTEKGDNIFIITDGINEECITFRIVLCKTNALPLIEEEGNLEDLEDYINKKQNIAEITHCVYFKDSGIVGVEFNFSGARISALHWYVPRVLHIDGDVDYIYDIKFIPKLHDKSYEKLAKNETLTLFNMCFKPDTEAYKDVLAHRSLFRGAVSSVPDAEIIEITVKRKKSKKNQYIGMNDVLDMDEIKSLVTQYRDDLGKFYISQGSYKDGVDLLSDKLVTKVDIIRTQRRTIDSKDAYKKIKEFYEEEVKP